MKSIEKYLIYILLLAVAGLYVLHFTTPQSEENHSASNLDTLSGSDKTEKKGRIYYVNTDSVWQQYQYVQEITKQLESKKIQYENQLEKELRQFETEVNDFRSKGPMMSEVEVQIKQRDLVRKESELGKMGEELERKFLSEEKEWNDKLRKKIIDYIELVTKEKSYDYILGYSLTSNIILANDSLDLTAQVVSGLNESYQQEKTEKK